MSLDVHLTMPVSEEGATGAEHIYVRRDGRTEEVTRAEWDELYPGREPAVVRLPHDEWGEVYWRNITHNLGAMARQADLYEALWRPETRGWTHARDLIEPLRHGLATLHSDPEQFKQLAPENGWGDYDGLLTFVASYLAACMKWPDAEVRVSR